MVSGEKKMTKLKEIFTNVRVIILLIFLLGAVLAIHPTFGSEGVTIRSVVRNSSAALAGLENPSDGLRPLQRERILLINNQPVGSEKDYYDFVAKLDNRSINKTISIKTTKSLYRLQVKPKIEYTDLNRTKVIEIEETVQANKTDPETNEVVLVNETRKRTEEVPDIEQKIVGIEDLGLRIYKSPTTNILRGLDLEGGTRVLLQPEEEVSEEKLDSIIQNMGQRLNAFGLADIVVKKVNDLSGNKFILVEVAGASEEDIKNLLSKQGKFEAKIGDEVVFIGGRDISHVFRTADKAGIGIGQQGGGCGQTADGNYVCRFRFAISLTPEAAQRQADITRNLEVVANNTVGESYLSKQLLLYLDEQLVDELNIGAELKGRAVTEIAISGSGAGSTLKEAEADAIKNMKRLQTILETGSLPVKLNIVKTDTVSPSLGEEFTKNAIFMGILSILSVALVIYARYRKLQIAFVTTFTMMSEILLLLGLAVVLRWNLDLAAIAGIIVAAGTGVDDQIVITDEVLNKRERDITGWKEKLKKAFFIIFAAYFTTVVAMIPLLFAGAGIVKGFALTTIAGISFGVFLTRPVFAKVIEILNK